MKGIEQAIPVLVGVLFLATAQSAFAEISSDFTRVDGSKEIAKNPTAQKILQQIELSKKILEELKSGTIKTEQTEHQKFIAEQRRIVQEQLQRDLNQMNKDYEGFTSKNSYIKFLNKVPEQHRQLYMEQFEYFDAKVQKAKSAKEQMLSGGASYHEAMAEYYKHAATKKVELIKVNMDLNIKYNFTDSELQSHFDEQGKLPRYEKDIKPCFSCQRYEAIAQKMIEDNLQKVSNSQQAKTDESA
jgi:hypothetical protein